MVAGDPALKRRAKSLSPSGAGFWFNELSGSLTEHNETSAANSMQMSTAAVVSSATLFLLLSSCAGFVLPPEEPTNNRPRIPGSGDIRFMQRTEAGTAVW